jgi:hypothetical protein
MKKKKTISKTAKRRELQKLNAQLHTQFVQSEIEKEREVADKKDALQIAQHEKSVIDDFETQLTSNEPIRELFNQKNIKFKTQITEEQRNAVSILYHAYLLCKSYSMHFEGLKFVLDEYIDFGVSIDRQGRSEYVDAHKATIPANNQNNQNNQNGVGNQMGNMKM